VVWCSDDIDVNAFFSIWTILDLFQILSLIAMESPASLNAEDIRNAKVRSYFLAHCIIQMHLILVTKHLSNHILT
jgi:hypothetical protein